MYEILIVKLKKETIYSFIIGISCIILSCQERCALLHEL